MTSGNNKTSIKLFTEAPDNPVQFTCSVYVVTSDDPDKGTLIVDPGAFTEEIKNYTEENGGLDAALITHSHWDHIYGTDGLKAYYPEAEVYINELDLPGLTDSVMNCSNTGPRAFIATVQSKVTGLTEGVYSIAGYKVEVIGFPGHSPGGSLYYFPEENIMFCGDCFGLERVAGAYKEEDPLKNTARTQSIARFKTLTFPDDMLIYFGHGKEPFTYKELMQKNVDFKD